MRAVWVIGLACVALVGCSNRNAPQTRGAHSGDVQVTAGAGGVQAVTIDGGDNMRFDPSTIHVHPGKVKITLDVTGTTPHELSFTKDIKPTIPLTLHGQHGSIEFTVTKPGRYPFVCQLHQREGMTGTMIVDSAR
jgi:plastocyanin